MVSCVAVAVRELVLDHREVSLVDVGGYLCVAGVEVGIVLLEVEEVLHLAELVDVDDLD